MSEREWTIMIYMAGDNNLAVDMAYAMEQIKSIPTEDGSSPNIFVYYDGNSRDIPTLYCDFTEPDRPLYVRSMFVPEKLYYAAKKVNENAATFESIVNFVDWCLNGVPVKKDGEITYGRRSKRYGLIFSGHSLGFQDIGLFKDESSGKSMKMSLLYNALARLVHDEKQLKKDAKAFKLNDAASESEQVVLVGKKLDLLGFDSCVMGMLEVGYQFGDVADVMIASEGSVPNAGWTYAKILGTLTGRGVGKLSTPEIAESFVRKFVQCQDLYTVGGVSVDMAAWKLDEVGELVVSFDRLSYALLRCFEIYDRVYLSMERAVLNAHWKCQSYMYDQNVDLGDFCELLAEECAIILDTLSEGEDLEIVRKTLEICDEVLGQLDKAIILSGFSGGEYQYSNGVSVFFPWSYEAYLASQKNYKELYFARESTRSKSWNAFLEKYLTEIARRKSVAPGIDERGKYRYVSGVKFDTDAETFSRNGLAASSASDAVNIEAKMPGIEGSKMPGIEGSKMPGIEGSKMPGIEGSKMPGIEGSKMPGIEGSKMPGIEGSKMGGGGGGKLFNALRLYKNIERNWNVSGFSKKSKHDD